MVEAELEVGEEEEVEADLVEVFAGQVLVEVEAYLEEEAHQVEVLPEQVLLG